MIPGGSAAWEVSQLPVNWETGGCIHHTNEDLRLLETKEWHKGHQQVKSRAQYLDSL